MVDGDGGRQIEIINVGTRCSHGRRDDKCAKTQGGDNKEFSQYIQSFLW
jgi:hypothetical protein